MVRAMPSFVDDYVKWKGAVVNDPAMLSVIWDSLCKFMLHRLLNEHLPVHLGFAKLFALQARANWKQAVFAKLFYKCSSRKPKPLHEDAGEMLTDGQVMCAWDEESRTLSWTLEINPTEEFETASTAFEVAKRGFHEPTYFDRAQMQLQRQMPEAYEIIRQHIQKTRKPLVFFPSSKRGGGIGVFERIGHPKRRPYPLESLSTCPVVTGAAKQKSSSRPVVSKNASVPKVSNLQSSAEDVRIRGSKLDEPNDSKEGDSRLLVLPSSQEPSTGELLPLPEHGRENGLVRTVEQ